jgi:hypothetical protein
MSHKQEILEELAEYNRKKGFDKAKFCSPPKRKRSKPKHPSENSEKLPPEIRGKHYDSCWQICADIGCIRYANFMKDQKRISKWAKPRKKKSRKKKTKK